MAKSPKSRKRKAEVEPKVESETEMESDLEMEIDSEELEDEAKASATETETTNLKTVAPKAANRVVYSESRFIGNPIPLDEAVQLYPRRYKTMSNYEKEEKKGNEKAERDDGDEQEDWQAKCHYTQAEVDGIIYNLFDDAYIQAEEGQDSYIARIAEFFQGVDGNRYYKALWYYRPVDTAIKDLKEHATMFDEKRIFLSEIKNTNELDSIVSKVNVIKLSPNLDPEARAAAIANCDHYYNMKYLIPNFTFSNADDEDDNKTSKEALSRQDSDPESTLSSDNSSSVFEKGSRSTTVPEKPKMNLLDLYSGCGAMSTGLSIGGALSGVNIVTRWAVDFNKYACESLKLNHPEAEVRNEGAQNFLGLLIGWQNLCREFNVFEPEQDDLNDGDNAKEDEEESEDEEQEDNEEIYEVEKLLGVSYGDPKKNEEEEKKGKKGKEEEEKKELHFKVRWKGYDDESEDTWEPISGLSDCKDKLKKFVREGYEKRIVPLPGDVDFICGGPPCQGISGFNRFRDSKTPFGDTKNDQGRVYFDIIQFLKPRYTLMENVVDILKFSDSLLGRYAIGRLVAMDYQCRIGQLVAGCYGVPQYRCRVFLWGARHSEKLPPYPLPTHQVHQNRGNLAKDYEDLIIGYQSPDEVKQLDEPLTLGDAIADLPPVENGESRDEISYGNKSTKRFHKFICLPKHKVVGFENTPPREPKLFDHRPLKLNQDDFERVQKIPKFKGANFRNLGGVKIIDNVVYLDPDVERPRVSSGKYLVPDYAISFIKGKSLKPFGRLWYDEIISTVVTRAEPHNQIIIHPEQDRVLTVRELARLQGFPDFYKLCGPVKERYKQVGNAVAVPVGTALGYVLGLASLGLCSSEPTVKIPFKFPDCLRST